MQFKVLPVPEHLKPDVECIRVTEYDGREPLAITVCLNGLPGIVFQHANGHSPIEAITTRLGSVKAIPTAYVYGQMTEPGVMHHKLAACTTTQLVLKPHGLHTLLGINAADVTNRVVDLESFAPRDLSQRLLDAPSDLHRVALLTNLLSANQHMFQARDPLVEYSLRLIHQYSASISVKTLLEQVNLSERQFEKRFSQTVGLPPQFYIRVKRFNRAIHLMKSGRFGSLTDIAHTLNFHDQAHFIRDIKAFSGVTPKNLAQKVDEFPHHHKVFAFA